MVDNEATQPDEASFALEERLRKLALDNEDLRFECSRLKAALERAQVEILALTDQGIDLRRRLDRIHRLAPRWSKRVIARLRALAGNR